MSSPILNMCIHDTERFNKNQATVKINPKYSEGFMNSGYKKELNFTIAVHSATSLRTWHL